MDDIYNLTRKNILSLTPYSSARDEYKNEAGIFLDANENPFGNLNRYPDPHQLKLKKLLSNQKKIRVENILIGNGSDEIIDLVQRVFGNPNQDKIIICPPTYGMYQVYANINDLEIVSIPLTDDFQLDTEKIIKQKAKIIYLCSPNNPTGNSLKNIEYIIKNFNGIVFLDEAYIDFSDQPSLISKIDQYPNLIVSQTFSKARGLAAIRVGIAYANKSIIALMDKLKPPYNVSLLNQEAAIQSLDDDDLFHFNVQLIKSEREMLKKSLLDLNFVIKIFPSEANFLLVKMKNATSIYNQLIEQKIITRNRSSVVENTIRISVGTPLENKNLVRALQTIIT